MKYRVAIENALTAWDGIWFHWNKSEESRSAAMILRRLMTDSPYDDELCKAVDWFLGASDVEFTYVRSFSPLKTSSALYTQLTDHLKSADPPQLKPVVVRETRPVRRQAPTQSSVQVRSTPVVTSSPSKLPLQILRHQDAWKNIKITDIPTGKHGRYEHTSDDFVTNQQKASAAGVVQIQLGIKGKSLQIPAYWIELGRMVHVSKKGRCFSCAGAAVFTLTQDEYFDNYELAIMGNAKYDHYFVCVGSSIGEIKSGLGTAIDIWQANLNGTTDVYAKSPAKEFMYWKGAEFTCVIPKESRQALRAFILERVQIEHV
ncbi:hypothetical protein AAFN46_19245 [Pseudomonas sp. CAU 1711]|uniref:hypothetical protein n=1 Tax=Pseudomonas sp. CAU 1711 TaxID=3140356 RepID=UPI0032610EAD